MREDRRERTQAVAKSEWDEMIKGLLMAISPESLKTDYASLRCPLASCLIKDPVQFTDPAGMLLPVAVERADAMAFLDSNSNPNKKHPILRDRVVAGISPISTNQIMIIRVTVMKDYFEQTQPANKSEAASPQEKQETTAKSEHASSSSATPSDIRHKTTTSGYDTTSGQEGKITQFAALLREYPLTISERLALSLCVFSENMAREVGETYYSYDEEGKGFYNKGYGTCRYEPTYKIRYLPFETMQNMLQSRPDILDALGINSQEPIETLFTNVRNHPFRHLLPVLFSHCVGQRFVAQECLGFVEPGSSSLGRKSYLFLVESCYHELYDRLFYEDLILHLQQYRNLFDDSSLLLPPEFASEDATEEQRRFACVVRDTGCSNAAEIDAAINFFEQLKNKKDPQPLPDTNLKISLLFGNLPLEFYMPYIRAVIHHTLELVQYDPSFDYRTRKIISGGIRNDIRRPGEVVHREDFAFDHPTYTTKPEYMLVCTARFLLWYKGLPALQKTKEENMIRSLGNNPLLTEYLIHDSIDHRYCLNYIKNLLALGLIVDNGIESSDFRMSVIAFISISYEAMIKSIQKYGVPILPTNLTISRLLFSAYAPYMFDLKFVQKLVSIDDIPSETKKLLASMEVTKYPSPDMLEALLMRSLEFMGYYYEGEENPHYHDKSLAREDDDRFLSILYNGAALREQPDKYAAYMRYMTLLGGLQGANHKDRGMPENCCCYKLVVMDGKTTVEEETLYEAKQLEEAIARLRGEGKQVVAILQLSGFDIVPRIQWDADVNMLLEKPEEPGDAPASPAPGRTGGM